MESGMRALNLLTFVVFIHETNLVVGDYTLTVLHTNDVHARFVSFNRVSRPCSGEDIEQKKCWGGASRRLTAVKKYRREEPNTIFVDGGDQYQGTIWFTALKWEPIARYMNIMKYDAIAFGNHEFDNGIEGLEPYLKNLDTVVVNSNIRDHGSAIKGLFRRKLIKRIGGQKIGIIGYTTTETPALSNTGKHLEFDDEIMSLQIVVDELQMEGVNKIIAVGHAGITVDRRICQEVRGVDIVVGGHTNTFLYTGTPPSSEVPEGPYPEVYTSTGSNCLVVQDYAFGKYLGKLKVVFDDHGVPKSWSNNNPVLIDSSFEPDPEMEALLKPYESRLNHYTKTVVGTTAVGLDGERKSCRLKECNLGNFLVDAAVFSYVEKTGRHVTMQRANDDTKSGTSTTNGWTRAAIGLWNGGGVRDYVTSSWNNITLEDLYQIMPFGNTIELIQLKGDIIRQTFEHAVGEYREEDAHGRFLQVSGVKVVYDLSKPKGSRVVSVRVRCAACEVPDYEPLDLEKIYDVITITYLTVGGDGFTVIKDNILKSDSSEILDIDVVMEYLRRYQPITAGNEGRIQFLGNGENGPVVSDTCNNGAGRLESAQSLYCYSCMSKHLESNWEFIWPLYRKPEQFSETCEPEHFRRGLVKLRNCTDYCISINAEKTIFGYKIPVYIRGCMSDVLNYRQDDDRLRKLRRKNGCETFMLTELFNDGETKIPNNEHVELCACHSSYCNGALSGTSMASIRSTLSLLTILLVILVASGFWRCTVS